MKHRVLRYGGYAGLAAAAFLVAACDRSQPAPAAPPPPAAEAAANPWDAYPASGQRESFAFLFRVARLADVWHGGKSPTVTLRFESPRSVTDGAGHSADAAPGQWKGLLALIAASPGTPATRALPAGNHNYTDGLGKAKRHAYTVAANPDGSITLTLVKALDEDSNG